MPTSREATVKDLATSSRVVATDLRRAERSMVALGVAARAPALSYVNRLSDWLFVAARLVNRRAGGDVLWVPGAQR